MSFIRVFFIILMLTALIIAGFTFADYKIYLNQREHKSLTIGEKVVNDITNDFSKILKQIQQRTETLADSLAEHEITGQTLLDLIENECKSMDQIVGVAVAFEPYAYNENTRLYSPYYDKNAGKMMMLQDLYDYTDPAVTSSRWYVDVVRGGARWIEPYFGQGAQAMITDYGVPFYRVNPETGISELVGTVTLTITLEDFTRLLNALSLGKTGYGFIVSQRGNYIAHPIKEYVSQKNILDIARENNDEVLARVSRLMLNRNSGFEQFNNTLSGQTSYLFYNYIRDAHWSLGIVFIKNELLGNPLLIRQKLMHIGFASSIFLILCFCAVFNIQRLETRRMWQLSMLVSTLIVANIVFVWYLTLTYSFASEQDERYKITNTSALNRFVELEDKKAEKLRIDQPIRIPTGVFINEIEFADSYNVNISATIWQHYDHGSTQGIKQAIQFPQTSPFAEAIYIDQRTETFPKYDLVTWFIRGTYRLDFDYSTYPFDFRHLDLIIAHPDKSNNIMLVPHLAGYKIINQSTKPGVNKQIVLPESEVDASYFDYSMESYNSTFGMENFLRAEIPQLHFNVILKRRFINAFVSNIIPIIIVAMMLYFLIYGSTKKGPNELSSIGVVESSAAFFFVLLLAHIDHRKTVNTPVITYMESFYFIMYVILGLMAFNIMMYTKRDNFLFFDYKDNFIVKISYWPLFLIICFVVTLMRFY